MHTSPEQGLVRMFAGRGFNLSFPNGFVVSVKIGPGYHADNYDVEEPTRIMTPQKEEFVKWQDIKETRSTCAEITIFKPEHLRQDKYDGIVLGDPLGYVSTSHIATIIHMVSTYTEGGERTFDEILEDYLDSHSWDLS